MTTSPFYLAIYDDDGQIFTIVGPMTDDTPWIDRIHQGASNGRKVRCSSVKNNYQETINEIKAGNGYEYTSSQLV